MCPQVIVDIMTKFELVLKRRDHLFELEIFSHESVHSLPEGMILRIWCLCLRKNIFEMREIIIATGVDLAAFEHLTNDYKPVEDYKRLSE